MHAAARMVMILTPAGEPAAIDFVHDNRAWAWGEPRLSVLVPTFRHDASELVAALAACDRAEEIEIVVHDDGSCDGELTKKLEAAADAARVPVRIVSASRNRGRSGARNQAASHARSPWLLLLDADMAPDGRDFLANYLDWISGLHSPSLVVGGYSLKGVAPGPEHALHAWQAARSETLPAADRAREPGRHVFTSNVVVHRDVLERFPFDEGFSGWGWEDVDWGLRVAAHHPVIHIDNTATHLGLDLDAALIAKYELSARNFARLVERHRDAMAGTPLYRAAKLMSVVPFRSPLASLARRTALDAQQPMAVRGRALKMLRALAYAEAV